MLKIVDLILYISFYKLLIYLDCKTEYLESLILIIYYNL